MSFNGRRWVPACAGTTGVLRWLSLIFVTPIGRGDHDERPDTRGSRPGARSAARRPRSAGAAAARAAWDSEARRLRGSRPAAYAATALQLRFRRRRGPRIVSRQSRGVPRVRIRSAHPRRRRAALAGDSPAGAYVRVPVRHRADGHLRDDGVPRRSRARARRRARQHPDGVERIVADPAGGSGGGSEGLLVPGIPAGRCRAHHGAHRPRRARRVRDADADRRHARHPQPRTQHPGRLHEPAASEPASRVGRPRASPMAARDVRPHAAPARHAAFRELVCDARRSDRFQRRRARIFRARPPRLEAFRARSPHVARQDRDERHPGTRKTRGSPARAASTRSSSRTTAAASSTAPCLRCACCRGSSRRARTFRS